jgi:hypothetical protein
MAKEIHTLDAADFLVRQSLCLCRLLDRETSVDGIRWVAG